jgi:DNA repair protein RadC
MSVQLNIWGDNAPSHKPTGDRRGLVTIHDLPLSERPAYRIGRYGPESLSTTELLGLVIGSALQLHDAQVLLATYGGLTGLARANLAELESQPGIGPATAQRIKAALALSQRIAMEQFPDRQQIRSPADAANRLVPTMQLLEHEEMHVITLDTKNRVLGSTVVARGNLNTTLMRVAEVFREAIRINCNSVIVAHNHPSGDPSPSPDDVAVTRQIVEAGKLLDIEVLDSLVVAGLRFVSMKERGLGF